MSFVDCLKNARLAGVAFLKDLADSAKGDALIAVNNLAIGGVNRTQHEKNLERITPLDFGAVGNASADGSSGTNDTAKFTSLETAYTNTVVDMLGKKYLVTSVPRLNNYFNGDFILPSASTDDQPQNTAIGQSALRDNTFIPRQHTSSTLTWASGNFNSAFGYYSLKANTIGRRNTAIGAVSLFSNTLGFYNVAVGSFSLYNNSIGNYNTAVGNQALMYNTGSNNTAIGNAAGIDNSNGVDNVAVGDNALKNTTNRNVAVGRQAAQTNTGNDSVAIGYQALSSPSSSGAYNVMIGSAAGGNLSTGNSNVGVGRRAMSANLLGSGNVAVGVDAMVSASGGDSNIAIGNTAIANGTTGYQNVGVGAQAFIALSSGYNNVGIGRYVGQLLTTGVGNVGVGQQALLNTVGGNYNTAIGDSSGSGGASYDNTTALGYGATTTGSNQVQLGNSNTTTYAYGAVQNRSDARDKADIEDTKLGLDFVLKLRPVDARWDFRSDYTDGIRDGSKKRSRKHQMLIAQEVKAAADSLGVDFGGYQDHTVGGGDDVLSIGYTELIPVLIKAIQDQQKIIESLKK